MGIILIVSNKLTYKKTISCDKKFINNLILNVLSKSKEKFNTD